MSETRFGTASKFIEVASVFICVHENGIKDPEKPRVFRIDVEQAKEKPYVIGRSSNIDICPDIILDSPQRYISRDQGSIGYTNNKWIFKPSIDSRGVVKNYILKNGSWSDITSTIELNSMDIIGFGWKKSDGKGSPVATMVFVPYKIGLNQKLIIINKQTINIGRVAYQNDIVLPISYVSKNHATIIKKNNETIIKDQKSLNGLWDSEGKITKRKLYDIDAFSISDILFVKIGENLFYSDPKIIKEENDVLIQANIIEKTVRKKTLIKNVNQLKINRGNLVAVIGGSGAGKTTLINCLNGLDKSYSGKVLFDGEDTRVRKNFNRLKYLVGIVPQANIIHPYLTVKQELTQAARLRCLGDSTGAEINRTVQDVVNNDLHLADCIDKKISVLSGGQARRVSIGVELVVKRTLLCLDEPDAGLDPLTKRNLFNDLKKLTNSGVTILVIIHDVSYMEVFDQVIVMGKYRDSNEKYDVGSMAFQGTPDEALDYFEAKDFTEVYEKLINNPQNYFKGAIV